ncbi:MAG: patatin-like phospholipase family protein [Gemmatimonadales bacterium]|nr:patatin-like phospholipase family protein [Gemmatimonadota bacterium]MCL4214099.1 patatin-like phospholipase family protein [Gemmatimonadales bacterium]
MTVTVAPTLGPRREFAIVLSGGGARGFSHAGVLRGLDHLGYRPSAVVGVSMGAIVGATYASRADWYEALLALDMRAFPQPLRRIGGPPSLGERVRYPMRLARVVWQTFFGWGAGTTALAPVRATLDRLTLRSRLEAARVPVAVCATDLHTGRRVVLRAGPTSDALHASAALAGVAPPFARGAELLADGVYADIAPVDVARSFGCEVVIAVDAGLHLAGGDVRNGFEALFRAVEICHLRHADLRFAEADLVLRPPFRRSIDTLDFGAKRESIAAGIAAVRAQRHALARLLTRPGPAAP